MRISFASVLVLAACGSASASPGFVQNDGQWDDRALFKSSSAGLDVWVTPTGATLDFSQIQGEERIGQVVKFTLSGSQGGTPRGTEELPGYFNWIGVRSATGVPHFAEAWVEDVLPGVDQRWYRDEGLPRYDLVLEPGVDPRTVRMNVEGADRIWIDDNDELVLDTRFGPTRVNDLFVYQTVGGQKREIRSSFKLHPDGTVGYDLAPHDPSLPLIIDPLIFATFVGGGGRNSQALDGSVGLDASGHSYLAVQARETDFPTTPGAYQVFPTGGSAVGVTKISPDGTQFVWSTLVAGEATEFGAQIHVTPGGTPTVAVHTESQGFPTTPRAFRRVHSGGFDVAVFRLTKDGSDLVFSTFYGGPEDDFVGGIDVDPSGCTVVAGMAEGDVPTSGNAFDTSHSAERDAFVARFSPDGTRLEAATLLGGAQSESVNGVTFAPNGDMIVVGSTGFDESGEAFPTTNPAFDRTYNGGVVDGFITRIAPDAGSLIFSTWLGGSSQDELEGVALAPNGDVVVSGRVFSSDIPITAGALRQTPPSGANSGYVALLSGDGTTLQAASYLAGAGAYDVRVDSRGRVYSMSRDSSESTPGRIFPALTSPETTLHVFSSDLAALLYATQVGPDTSATSSSLDIDPFGTRATIGTGNFGGYPTTPGAAQPENAGDLDAVVIGLDLTRTAKPGGLFRDAENLPYIWRIDDRASGQKNPLPHFETWSLQLGDFDGDEASDILAYDPTTGNVMISIIKAGREQTRRVIGTVLGAFFSMADFDGDGDDDILVQQSSTSQTLVWIVEDGQRVQNVTFGPRVNWEPSFGDMDGDGDDDIVWRLPNGTLIGWLMDGATRTDQQILTFQPNIKEIVDDFDGDGKADILLINETTGLLILLRMDGLIRIDARALGTFPNRAVVDTADSDGDGDLELVLFDSPSSLLIFWDFTDNMITDSGSPGNPAGTFLRFADVDGDGGEDVLLFDVTNDFWKVWLMDGMTLKRSVGIGPVSREETFVDAGWF